MNWIENLLILVGISLDIFAGMECQGSLVAKIDKKHLTLVCFSQCVIIRVWQFSLCDRDHLSYFYQTCALHFKFFLPHALPPTDTKFLRVIHIIL